jgi:hypothetical protein
MILHKWIQATNKGAAPISFADFESVISKLQHEFISVPAGSGMLSQCNSILAKRPPTVALGLRL